VLLLAPPEPAEPSLLDAGVKTQPCASKHCALVTPEHVPRGVPVQFGDQKHPGTLRQR
jgi:hypothetical protein